MALQNRRHRGREVEAGDPSRIGSSTRPSAAATSSSLSPWRSLPKARIALGGAGRPGSISSPPVELQHRPPVPPPRGRAPKPRATAGPARMEPGGAAHGVWVAQGSSPPISAGPPRRPAGRPPRRAPSCPCCAAAPAGRPGASARFGDVPRPGPAGFARRSRRTPVPRRLRQPAQGGSRCRSVRRWRRNALASPAPGGCELLQLAGVDRDRVASPRPRTATNALTHKALEHRPAQNPLRAPPEPSSKHLSSGTRPASPGQPSVGASGAKTLNELPAVLRARVALDGAPPCPSLLGLPLRGRSSAVLLGSYGLIGAADHVFDALPRPPHASPAEPDCSSVSCGAQGSTISFASSSRSPGGRLGPPQPP